jgi:hypothetical protein
VGRLVKALAGVAVLFAFAAAPAHGRSAYVIKQREGRSVSVLTLAPSGLRFDALAPARRGGRAKPFLGMIIRYRTSSLLLLDPEKRRYQALPLASAISSYEAELRAVRGGQPSERLPVRPGARPRSGQAPLSRPRARLKRLPLTARIGPVRVRAYLLRQGKVHERLWYAAELPRPPARIRALLRRALSPSKAAPFARALRGQAGRVPLRIDVPRGRRWRTVLRTVRIERRALGAHALDPPRGFKKRDLLPAARRAPAQAADVPGGPIRCGIAITDPINCTIGWLAPVSGHPDIWAFYWGSRFDDRKDFVGSVNRALHDFVGDEFAHPLAKGFWGPLGQYGVHQGRLLGYDIVDDNPPDSVGSWNFFAVEAFVFTHRFGSDAPNYWWRYIGHDPIFAIFVDQDEVDSSGWGGYHFFTPTEGVLFDFLVHPNIPWFIVKVPSLASLPTSRDSPAYRAAVDKTTDRASHEFVEAATDPYPFLSWADPLKQPIWEEGEIADICQQGNTNPWGKRARVVKYGTAFSSYWSNDDDACVPDSRPSAVLAYPSGSPSYTYGWKSQVTFIVHTDDVYDGGPVADSNIRWNSDRDGFDIGRGYIFTTSKLSPGLHHISAFVSNSQGGSRLAGPVTVNIEVHPPNVRIDQPADGASFGYDQTINFRGSAFDPQDGDLATSATWSVDGTPVGTGASFFQYRIPTQGTHTVTLSATNSAGASSSTSITLNIGPATGKPTVQITSPPSGYNAGTGELITFSASASTQGGATIADSGYSWTDDRDGPLGSGQTIQRVLTGGPCYIADHHVTVTVTDSFGRTATDTITVNVGSVC